MFFCDAIERSEKVLDTIPHRGIECEMKEIPIGGILKGDRVWQIVVTRKMKRSKRALAAPDRCKTVHIPMLDFILQSRENPVFPLQEIRSGSTCSNILLTDRRKKQ